MLTEENMINKRCECCSKTYQVHPSSMKRKYCSQDCMSIAMRGVTKNTQRVDKKCKTKYCRNFMTQVAGNRLYCKSCQHKRKNARSNEYNKRKYHARERAVKELTNIERMKAGNDFAIKLLHDENTDMNKKYLERRSKNPLDKEQETFRNFKEGWGI